MSTGIEHGGLSGQRILRVRVKHPVNPEAKMVETPDDPYYLFDNHYMVYGDWLEFRQWAEPPGGLHLHRGSCKLHIRMEIYGGEEN